MGVDVRAVDRKLEQLAAAGDSRVQKAAQLTQQQPLEQPLKAEGAAATGEGEADADFESKPIPRAASSMAAECIQAFRSQVQEFDNVWNNLRGDSEEAYRKRWNAMAALRASVEGQKPTIEGVPTAAAQLCNPFAANNGPASQWDWLTNPRDLLTKPEFDELHAAYSPNSVQHPFVHPNSLYAGQVSIEEALTPSLVSQLLDKPPSAIASAGATATPSTAVDAEGDAYSQAETQSMMDSVADDGDPQPAGHDATTPKATPTGRRPRGRPPSSGASARRPRRQNTPTGSKLPQAEVARLPSYLRNLSNGDPEFEDAMLQQRARHATDLSESEDFQDCLERLLNLVEADLNGIFVDRAECAEPPPSFPADSIQSRKLSEPTYPDTMHRAQVVAHLFNRTTGVPPFLEGTARRVGARKVRDARNTRLSDVGRSSR